MADATDPLTATGTPAFSYRDDLLHCEEVSLAALADWAMSLVRPRGRGTIR